MRSSSSRSVFARSALPATASVQVRSPRGVRQPGHMTGELEARTASCALGSLAMPHCAAPPIAPWYCTTKRCYRFTSSALLKAVGERVRIDSSTDTSGYMSPTGADPRRLEFRAFLLIDVPRCPMARFTVSVVSNEGVAPAADPAPARAIAPRPAGALLAEQLPVLRVIARALCRDHSKAEDLVQDTFERALRALDQLDPEKNPRSWMVTILNNLHIDRCRQLARLEPHVPCDEVPLSSQEATDAPIWSTLTTDDVARAVAELPGELQTTYCLFALEGKSYIEIAKRLGISKTTVGTRILRARAHLKKKLVARLGEGAP